MFAFSNSLEEIFKNCLVKPLNDNMGIIEGFICVYYGINKKENEFYNKMGFLYDSFYNNKKEFEKEISKIKVFTEWQLF